MCLTNFDKAILGSLIALANFISDIVTLISCTDYMTQWTNYRDQCCVAEVTYKDGGDDEGAVSQGVRDVHPFSLRRFCDVKPSRYTPLPNLRKMRSTWLSVLFLLVSCDRQENSAVSSSTTSAPGRTHGSIT